jgi:hypothetical protein
MLLYSRSCRKEEGEGCSGEGWGRDGASEGKAASRGQRSVCRAGEAGGRDGARQGYRESRSPSASRALGSRRRPLPREYHVECTGRARSGPCAHSSMHRVRPRRRNGARVVEQERHTPSPESLPLQTCALVTWTNLDVGAHLCDAADLDGHALLDVGELLLEEARVAADLGRVDGRHAGRRRGRGDRKGKRVVKGVEAAGQADAGRASCCGACSVRFAESIGVFVAGHVRGEGGRDGEVKGDRRRSRFPRARGRKQLHVQTRAQNGSVVLFCISLLETYIGILVMSSAGA